MLKMNPFRKLTILAMALLAATLGLGACSLPAKEQEYEQTFLAMDTIMSITVYGTDEDALKEATDAAIAEINRLDALLSTGNADSEVAKLNAAGGGELSDTTSYLLERSLELYRSTNGAFDITIYPVMRAWGFTDENFRVPEDDELAALLANVNAGAISYSSGDATVTLPKDTEVDFGGIAKGYTSGRVAEILKSYGIEHAIMSLGGNVHVIGTKTDGTPWKIGIQDPDDSSAVLCAIEVTDEAVVTSGGYERNFEEDGITYHHIIDPSTGYPAYNGLTSVSIICKDSTLADGLSTALFVMGTDQAIAYYKEHADEFECVLYTDDGTLYVSPGLADRVSSERAYTIIE